MRAKDDNSEGVKRMIESYMGRYFSVSYTGLKKARKDLSEKELVDLAVEETATFFEISKEEVREELNLD